MARYIVNAPDGKEVSVATPYGIQKFINGSFISDDRYSQLYPNIFIKVPEFNEAVVEEVIKETKSKKKVEKKIDIPKDNVKKKSKLPPKKK